MEAKQSRESSRPKELHLKGQSDLFNPETNPRGDRGANRVWDQLLSSARQQTQDCAQALPIAHGWPLFLLICDVGHCIEVNADFAGQGKSYAQSPDRQCFRVSLTELRDEAVRARFKRICEGPTDVDPNRQPAKITREIAARLAAVSEGLESRKHDAENVALFRMRCLFTIFAEDIGLLLTERFKQLVGKCAAEPKKFAPMVELLWTAMDKGDFAYAIEQAVCRCNGKLFKRSEEQYCRLLVQNFTDGFSMHPCAMYRLGANLHIPDTIHG